MRNTLLSVTFLAFTLLGCGLGQLVPANPAPVESSAAPTAPAEAPAFRPADCPFAPTGSDARIDCGWLTVPENRSRADSPTIELAVAILRPAEPPALPDPVIYLEGGPGGSALVSLSSDIDGWRTYPFHQNRDVIFIDQRGTGYSRPSLDCPEYFDESLANPDAACQRRLRAEGIDLAAYNTAENAADIAALRRALGYSQVNLLGVSYGTRLALAVMRDHPDGLRSVVLDSPFPPAVDFAADSALAHVRALRLLFATCAAAPDCAAAYPNLEALFFDTVTAWNDHPGQFDTGQFYGDDLADTLIEALYLDYLIPYLPRTIAEVANGDFSTYNYVFDEAFAYLEEPPVDGAEPDRSDSEGMYNSVICHDEYAFSDEPAIETVFAAQVPPSLQPLLQGTTAGMFDLCHMWGAGKADPRENEPVSSDVPTLILTGQFDPITPPDWGRAAAKTLSHAYLFELPGFGHSVTSTTGCPDELLAEFLANPAAAPAGGCVAQLPAIDFVLPDEPLEY